MDESAPSEADPEPDEVSAEDETAKEPLTSNDPAVCKDHGLAHPEDRPWLPKQDNEDLAPHPYCTECGEVMGLGRAGGLDEGDLANLLGHLKKELDRAGHVVTEVQRRLIMKKIKEEGLDDPFGFTRDTQLTHVCEIASTYLGIPENVIMSYVKQA